MHDDVLWVYAHLGDDQIRPTGVPSVGAWSLWRWARENASEFFEGLWPKAEAVQATRRRLEADEYCEDKGISELEEMLESVGIAREDRGPSMRTLRSQLGSTLADEVRDTGRRCGLEVSQAAAESLAANGLDDTTLFSVKRLSINGDSFHFE